MRIATFNVWHGLAGRDPRGPMFPFREFETRERRDDRWRLTLRLLNEASPDIILLQELNPVSKRGFDLTQALGGTFQGCVDQSGFKVFSRGFPNNLATGLGIVIRGEARPARLREDDFNIPLHTKLSGSFGVSGEEFSFHLSEQRHALFSSIHSETHGRLLVVNTHLHHGFERFPDLLRLLAEKEHEGKITRSEIARLEGFLDRARDRRLSEVDRILEVIANVESSHDGVVLGGDFNSLETSAAYQLLILSGFKDLAEFGKARNSPTWDPITNFENHKTQREVGFNFPLPTFGNDAFTEVYRGFDSLPRRIDFLMAKGSLVADRPSAVEIIGAPKEKDDLVASDHFGILAKWK